MRTHDDSPPAPSADIATTGAVFEMTNAATMLLLEQLNNQRRMKWTVVQGKVANLPRGHAGHNQLQHPEGNHPGSSPK